MASSGRGQPNMEINNVEAVQTYKTAIEKFYEHDFAGAKRYVLELQTIFPEHLGLKRFFEVLNVHISAMTYIYGERDWYRILRVDPTAPVDEIRKSYKKLLLSVHPDKHKLPALATEAYHLVKEAWNVLREQESRAAYDQRRKGKCVVEEPSTADTNASTSTQVPSGGVPFYDFFNDNAAQPTSPPPAPPSPGSSTKAQTSPGVRISDPQPESGEGTSQARKETDGSSHDQKPQQGSTGGSIPKQQARKDTSRSNFKKATPSIAKPETFWTICAHCKMRYEYERIYLNTKLMCPASKCNKLFKAVMVRAPRRKYQRRQNGSSKTTKASTSSTAAQDVPGSSSSGFKVPKAPSSFTTSASPPASAFKSSQTPVFATPLSSVPASGFGTPQMPFMATPISSVPASAFESPHTPFSSPTFDRARPSACERPHPPPFYSPTFDRARPTAYQRPHPPPFYPPSFGRRPASPFVIPWMPPGFSCYRPSTWNPQSLKRAREEALYTRSSSNPARKMHGNGQRDSDSSGNGKSYFFRPDEI